MRFRCPVHDCKFHNKPQSADVRFFKNHLMNHDRKELQIAALQLGIITSPTEFRHVWWLIQQIATTNGCVFEN